MSKIKEFFSGIWTKVAAVALGLVALLLWMLNIKQKKINALTADLELADTKEEVTKIETEIKSIEKSRAITKSELDEVNKALVKLENKKKKVAEAAGNKTEKEIEDYWNS